MVVHMVVLAVDVVGMVTVKVLAGDNRFKGGFGGGRDYI